VTQQERNFRDSVATPKQLDEGCGAMAADAAREAEALEWCEMTIRDLPDEVE
jgi:hypothetical protein